MKGLLKCVGSLAYSLVAGYLLWLLFYWLTPLVMGMSWGWFVVYLIIGSMLISFLYTTASSILMLPVVFLTRGNKAAKILSIPSYLFHGFSAARLPFSLDMDYGLLQWLLSISLVLAIIGVFYTMVVSPFVVDE